MRVLTIQCYEGVRKPRRESKRKTSKYKLEHGLKWQFLPNVGQCQKPCFYGKQQGRISGSNLDRFRGDKLQCGVKHA
jgi:hypothetical protein